MAATACDQSHQHHQGVYDGATSMLYVAELTYPGTFISLPDGQAADEAQWTVHTLDSQLCHLAVSLNLFNLAAADASAPSDTALAEWEQRRRDEHETATELVGQIETERGVPLTFEERVIGEIQVWSHAARRAAHKRWSIGIWPDVYVHSRAFTHAISFVHSLHVFSLLMERLVQGWKGCQPELKGLDMSLRRAIPDLDAVRDSLSHFDERVRKKASRRRNTYDLTPVESWDYGSLSHQTFRILVADWPKRDEAARTVPGRLGRIEVSRVTAEVARDHLQRAIDAFQWTGTPKIHPQG